MDGPSIMGDGMAVKRVESVMFRFFFLCYDKNYERIVFHHM